ncbi:MAG: DoxX family protein [Tetrasphaera sp.]
MSVVRKIARPLLAGIFVVAGLDTLRHPGTRAAKAEPVVRALARPLGLPDDTELMVRANGATMVAAGGLLAAGRFPRLASLALATSLVPTTAAGHAFWNETDPSARSRERVQFLKNVGLLGGLLLASVDTEGKPGLAYRAKLLGDSAQRTAASARKDARHAARAAKREARLKVAEAHSAIR